MSYYDPDEIRAISLKDVARRLELSIDENGFIDCLSHWGAEGSGHNSCSLVESDNYFRCPCGNSGWTTDLVTQARKCDIVEAIQWLGTEFNLTPVRAPKKTDYVSRSRGLKSKSQRGTRKPLFPPEDKELPEDNS